MAKSPGGLASRPWRRSRGGECGEGRRAAGLCGRPSRETRLNGRPSISIGVGSRLISISVRFNRSNKCLVPETFSLTTASRRGFPPRPSRLPRTARFLRHDRQGSHCCHGCRRGLLSAGRDSRDGRRRRRGRTAALIVRRDVRVTGEGHQFNESTGAPPEHQNANGAPNHQRTAQPPTAGMESQTHNAHATALRSGRHCRDGAPPGILRHGWGRTATVRHEA